MGDFFDGLEKFDSNQKGYYDIKARYSNTALKMADPEVRNGNPLKYKMYVNNELPFDGNKATRIGTMVDDCLMKGKTIRISNVSIPSGDLAAYVKYVFNEHVLDQYKNNGHREDMLWNIESFDDLFISERANCLVWASKKADGSYKTSEESFLKKIHALAEYWQYLIDCQKEVLCTKTDFKEVMNCIKGFMYSPHNLSNLMGVTVEFTETEVIPHLIDENDNYIYVRDLDVRILAKDCIYTDSKIGVSRKILIDFLRIDKHNGNLFLADLKTGTGASNYSSTIIKRKLDAQLAWYKSVLIDAAHSGEFSHQPSESVNVLEYLASIDTEFFIDCAIVILDKEIPLGLRYNVSEERLDEKEKYLYKLIEELEVCWKDQNFVDPSWKEPLEVVSTEQWKQSLDQNEDIDLDFI